MNIAMNAKGAIDRSTVLSINTSNTQNIKNSRNLESLNKGSTRESAASPVHISVSSSATRTFPTVPRTSVSSPVPQIPDNPPSMQFSVQKPLPPLAKPVQKGQKLVLASARPIDAVNACFGWNTLNPQCDVDVSAFLLDAGGKVLGDSWFVFYGQTISPDQSAEFHIANTTDREIISINFRKLSPAVKKIVFVLTINDAFEKNLNFGMIKDAYIRILDANDKTELISFQMTDYYSNVISMMIGEIYLHNDTWKFHAIGNGVAKDLAGLCTLYGVEVND